MESCDVCGFVWESVERAEVAGRATAAADAIAALTLADPDRAVRRPSPERWSAVEYAAHVRDVLMTLRDRIVIGLVEDHPGFKPLYREERIDLGLYRADTPDVVATELVAAAGMFARLFEAVEPGQLSRTVEFGYPTVASRTLLWVAQQAVHEAEHHLADVAEDLSAPRG